MNLIVAFSGGRTSGYMCKWIKENWEDKHNIKYVFCNTGQEHEKTLEFVNKCDIEFDLNLVWLEAKIHKRGVGTTYNIVTYETANRIGKPFKKMVKKYGLPNSNYPHCTRELKIEPMKKFAKSLFGYDYSLVLGIRVDEPRRLNQSKTDNLKLYPLATDNPMSKLDIIEWWSNQSFDLEIPEHLGNCTWCWKKSDIKLKTLAVDYPEIFKFPRMLEKKYSKFSNTIKKEKRVFFRGYKTTKDILKESKLPFKKFVDPIYEDIIK